MPNVMLVIVIVSGALYLICDWIESRKLAAVQELARIIFATSSLAYFLGAWR